MRATLPATRAAFHDHGLLSRRSPRNYSDRLEIQACIDRSKSPTLLRPAGCIDQVHRYREQLICFTGKHRWQIRQMIILIIHRSIYRPAKRGGCEKERTVPQREEHKSVTGRWFVDRILSDRSARSDDGRAKGRKKAGGKERKEERKSE